MTKAEFQRNEYLNELASTLVDNPAKEEVEQWLSDTIYPHNLIAFGLRVVGCSLSESAEGESQSASQSLYGKSEAYNEIAELAEKEGWIKCSPLADQPELVLCQHCGDRVQVGMLHRCPKWKYQNTAERFVEVMPALQTVAAVNAIPGRFYESDKWGRVLCCGSSSHSEYLPAFAMRTLEGRTVMKYLSGEVRESAVQGW